MTAAPKAMVMAAGLGKRMRPLTETMPKPLVPVAGKALIDHTLDWLHASGIKEAVVNTHYLASMLEEHLKERPAPHIHISREEVLLETGGGVKKAMTLLGDAPFVSTNSDVICVDGDSPTLQRMQQHWDDDTMDILLLLHPVAKAVGYYGNGDFFWDEAEGLSRRGASAEAPYVFTGVQMIHPRLFVHAPDEDVFSLNYLYDYALSATPPRLAAIIHDGDWLHIGDPQGVEDAEAFFATR